MSLFVQKDLGELIIASGAGFNGDGYAFSTSGISTVVFNNQYNIKTIIDAAKMAENNSSTTFMRSGCVDCNFAGSHTLVFCGCDRVFMDTITSGEFKTSQAYGRITQWMDENTTFLSRAAGFQTFIENYKVLAARYFEELGATPTPAQMITIEPTQIQPIDNEDPVIDARIKAAKRYVASHPDKLCKISPEGFLAMAGENMIFDSPMEYLRAAEKLCKQLHKNVIMANMTARVSEEEIGPACHIFCVKNYSISGESTAVSGDPIVLGKRTQSFYVPVGAIHAKSRAFCDYATGIAFAYMRGDDLFIMTRSDLITTVINAVAERYSITNIKSIMESDKAVYENALNAVKEDMISYIGSKQNNSIERIRSEFNEVHDEIDNYNHRLAELMRRYSEMLEVITTYDESKIQEKKRAGIEAQIRNLLATPKILSLKYDKENGRLKVYTSDIRCENPETKKIHDIGRFEITINMHGRFDGNSTIRIVNLKHKIIGFAGGNMEAPHVFNNGYPCLGSVSNMMIQEFGKLNIYNMVMGLIIFLESVNTADSAGAFIKNFPLYVEEEMKEEVRIKEMDDNFERAIA